MKTTGEPKSIRQLLEQATRSLHLNPDSDSARLDAEILLTHVLGKARSYLHAWPEKRLPAETAEQFNSLLQRRASGEPVAHLVGQREFWSLPLTITTDTLIPRPETETLVALALEIIPADVNYLVADLGTGSGAIALALAHERPRCRVVATDTSPAAIEVAQFNARQLGFDNIEFHIGDWCEPLAGEQCDVIVSNPPYIPEADPHLDKGDVRFEPRTALMAGPQGMNDLEKIAHCAHAHLQTGGWLLLEHGYDQGKAAMQLLESTGFHDVADHTDDAGLSRVIAGKR
jgi:release factor glutamine methyltransferase